MKRMFNFLVRIRFRHFDFRVDYRFVLTKEEVYIKAAPKVMIFGAALIVMYFFILIFV